jgi:ATP-dependent RNA helicase RhlE
MTFFNDFGLIPELNSAIKKMGYTEPTPVQTEAIPLILSGVDLLAGAQTGTGKTAGFVIPLLQNLMKKKGDKHAKSKKTFVRCLILTPTRELASQIEENVKLIGKNLPFKSAVIFGGVSYSPQFIKLRKGVDILVATPGRLLDLISQKAVDLSRVEILVVDEADRMLDMGFIHDVKKILSTMPKKRQNLLFSATISQDVKLLARDLLNDPQSIQVAQQNSTAEGVSQVVHPVDSKRKAKLLAYLIKHQNWRQVLVFTKTKIGADRLAKKLVEDGITATTIHGDKSQSARTKALNDFKKGIYRVLVATDVAARGLDIDLLPHVVNFDLPFVPLDYVHRIGRTGRAGHTGQAISLVSIDEQPLLHDIEKVLNNKIERIVVEGFEPDPLIKSTPNSKKGFFSNKGGGSKSKRKGPSSSKKLKVSSKKA